MIYSRQWTYHVVTQLLGFFGATDIMHKEHVLRTQMHVESAPHSQISLDLCRHISHRNGRENVILHPLYNAREMSYCHQIYGFPGFLPHIWIDMKSHCQIRKHSIHSIYHIIVSFDGKMCDSIVFFLFHFFFLFSYYTHLTYIHDTHLHLSLSYPRTQSLLFSFLHPYISNEERKLFEFFIWICELLLLVVNGCFLSLPFVMPPQTYVRVCIILFCIHTWFGAIVLILQ